MSKFKTVLIGLGNIGMEYDFQKSDEFIQTHAKALSLHPKFDFLGAVDPKDDKRERFQEKFSLPAWKSLTEAPAAEIYVIASATGSHLSLIQEVCSRGPKLVLCEKPLAKSYSDCQKILEITRNAKTELVVNYIRRYEPGAITLKKMIADGKFGKIIKGSGYYSKGLKNNGSHLIDLLSFLLGTPSSGKTIRKLRNLEENDFESDIQISWDQTEFSLLAVPEENFSLFEFNLVGTRGQIIYRNGGHEIQYRIAENNSAPNSFTNIPTNLFRYQWHVVEAVAEHLAQKRPLPATAEDAANTIKLIESLG